MIEINNITKRFGEKELFVDFNETIQTKEFVIFSGESGCGKTTLLNIIGYLEPLTAGEILVDGINYEKSNRLIEYYRFKVGFPFQNYGLIENKTVQENLNMVKPSTRTMISNIEALEKVGLADQMNQKVYKLSGGEQQRVALARLLIKQCQIILADEPTGSLDQKNSDRVLDILESFDKTIVLVTHDESIKKRADRVIDL